MTESMKFLSLVVGGIMVIIAAIATPISIVYALYMWGGEGHAIGYAACKRLRLGFVWLCL